jgi:1L-myo-inositol 1-phosphate cytidylyltransferase
VSGRAGIVLAAGFGSRLRENDDDAIKPLTLVDGEPLLHRAIRGLASAGCDRAVVVVGYRSEDLQAAIAGWDPGLPVQTVVNDRYDLANGVSVLAAAPHVGEAFVVTMADHVLSEGLLALAGAHTPVPGGATLLVDRRIAEVFDLDDATKVRTGPDGRIIEIGKTLAQYDAIDTGVFVCSRGLLDALQAVLDAHGDATLSQGVARLAASGLMHTLDVGSSFWQDVDTPQMLAHAIACLRRT